GDQSPTQHGHGLPPQKNSILPHRGSDRSPSIRYLISHEIVATEALGPERPEGAVRRSGDRVLAYPQSRSKEARDEVEPVGDRGAGDDYAPGVYGGQQGEVRVKSPNRLFVGQFDEQVGTAAPDPDGLGAEGPRERLWDRRPYGRLGG